MSVKSSEEVREDILRARNPKKYSEGMGEDDIFDVEEMDNDAGVLSSKKESKSNNDDDNMFSDVDDDFDIFGDVAKESAKKGFHNENNSKSSGLGQGTQVAGQAQGDMMDKMFDGTIAGLMNAVELLSNVINSFVKNTLDDTYSTFKSIGIITFILFVIGIMLYILGMRDIEVKMAEIGITVGVGSGLNLLVSVLVISIVQLISYKPITIEQLQEKLENKAEKLSDETISEELQLETDYGRSMEDIMKEVLGDEYDEYGSEEESEEEDNFGVDENGEYTDGEDDEEEEKGVGLIDLEDLDGDDNESDVGEVNINSAGIMTRESLFNTFSPLLKANNINFAKQIKVEDGSEEWQRMEEIMIKAFSNVTGKETDEVSKMTEMVEFKYSQSSIELRMERIKKQDNLELINKQIDAYSDEIIKYFCDKSQLHKGEFADGNVISTNTTLEGDYYKIVIGKPNNNIVLIGDLLKNNTVKDFILDEGNELPIIWGVDELGKPVYNNLRNFPSGIIGGQMRSGKTWLIEDIIAQLCMFNTPEDVQILLFDPKDTIEFKTMSLLPHCCGFIGGEGINEAKRMVKALHDINTKEFNYRAEIFKENNVSNIWGLRKKGIKMPVLFILIDEFMTLKSNVDELEEYKKRFDGILNSVVTRLPSQGIFTYIVSHKFAGQLSTTIRQMATFKMVLKNDDLKEETFEPKELKRFTKKLRQQGDTAYKTTGDVSYMRTFGITKSDDKNLEIFRTVAKGWYKLGVEIPSMEHIGRGYTRDKDKIREMLFGKKEDSNTTVEKYDDDGNDVADEIEI